MNILRAIRATAAILMALALTMWIGGCGKPAAEPTAHPDGALLAGRWQQFVPVESLPEQLQFDPSGTFAMDGETGRWKISGGLLVLRQGGGERSFSYTVSGYMLTLFDVGTDTSGFYINPDGFAREASGNGELAGQWAAFDSWGKLDFDGKGNLKSIVHTEAGDTAITQAYAARDGILQAEDTSGNISYNLYSMSQDGALLLAEASDYDSDVKHWTPYWKRVDPDSDVLGSWTRVIRSGESDQELPQRLTLGGGGLGEAAGPGVQPVGFTWEYYQGGFILMRLARNDHLYAWCGAEGSVLFVGNPNVDECWYIDESRFRPTAGPLEELRGRWASEDGSVSLEITDGGFALSGRQGEKAVFQALAADGMLKLTQSGKTCYAAYSQESGTLRLYGAGLPVIGQMEMPVVLVREASSQ